MTVANSGHFYMYVCVCICISVVFCMCVYLHIHRHHSVPPKLIWSARFSNKPCCKDKSCSRNDGEGKRNESIFVSQTLGPSWLLCLSESALHLPALASPFSTPGLCFPLPTADADCSVSSRGRPWGMRWEWLTWLGLLGDYNLCSWTSLLLHSPGKTQ